MGSKFLQPQASSTNLTNGTANINIRSEVVQTLAPSLPVHTSAGRQLVSGLIELADCDFVPLTNPIMGTLSVRDLITQYDSTPIDLNSTLHSLLSATQFQTASVSPNTTTIASAIAGWTVLAPAAGINIGAGASTAGSSQIAIGPNATATAANTIVLGSSSSASAAGGIAIGTPAVASDVSAICIGAGSSATVAGCIVLGAGIANGVRNTCIIGGGSIVSISPGSTVCDLGTVSNPIQNIIMSGYIDAPTAILRIAPAAANAVSIGYTGIDTTINGDLIAPQQAYGSWYCSSGFATSFTSGMPTFVAVFSATAGLLNFFIQAVPGLLRYTGGPPRTCRVDYDITYIVGASGANMLFFNSINSSLTIGTQTQISVQATPNNTGSTISQHFSDLIYLNNGDALQLAATCAQTTSINFTYVSCVITALFD